MTFSSNWIDKEQMKERNRMEHRDYEVELYVYQAIANGDVEYIDALCSKEHFEDLNGLGKLAKDPWKSIQYHYVISVALIVRACVEAGLPYEEGFNLSDFYIQELENCKTPQNVDELEYHMNIDFAKRMQLLRKKNSYSKPISKCMNYIYWHLHGKITIDELAHYLKMNKSHLSRMFKTETDYTIQEYINIKRIQEAKKMLKYSEFSCNEIAHNLGFCSQSHFTKAFRTETNMTPNAYRKQFSGKSKY